jgi:hypothetical protein
VKGRNKIKKKENQVVINNNNKNIHVFFFGGDTNAFAFELSTPKAEESNLTTLLTSGLSDSGKKKHHITVCQPQRKNSHLPWLFVVPVLIFLCSFLACPLLWYPEK